MTPLGYILTSPEPQVKHNERARNDQKNLKKKIVRKTYNKDEH